MFFAVIASYVICAVFAFCGVINLVNYIGSAQKEMGYYQFIEGLAVAAWPLAAAIAILLLIQIACLIEKWMLLWRLAQGSTPAPHDHAEPPARRHAAAHAPAAQPAPAPRPAMPPTPVAPTAASVTYPAQFAAVTPPVLGATTAVAPAPMPTVQLTPQGIAPAPASMSATPAAAPQQMPAQQQENLSFFKLD